MNKVVFDWIEYLVASFITWLVSHKLAPEQMLSSDTAKTITQWVIITAIPALYYWLAPKVKAWWASRKKSSIPPAVTTLILTVGVGLFISTALTACFETTSQGGGSNSAGSTTSSEIAPVLTQGGIMVGGGVSAWAVVQYVNPSDKKGTAQASYDWSSMAYDMVTRAQLPTLDDLNKEAPKYSSALDSANYTQITQLANQYLEQQLQTWTEQNVDLKTTQQYASWYIAGFQIYCAWYAGDPIPASATDFITKVTSLVGSTPLGN